MNLRYLVLLVLGIAIITGCSDDNSIVDPEIPEYSISNFASMPRPPEYENPYDLGDNEFTPPYSIILSINAIYYSNGNRIVTAGAEILDFYGRPFTNSGIQVYFEIIPDTLVTFSSPVYTNDLGWAMTKLEYPPNYALQEIQLIASCAWTADTATFELPLISPDLELNADPVSLWLEQPGTFDTSYIGCRLSDGRENYIAGGLVRFTALVAGEICGPECVYTGEGGWAYTHYRIGYEEIPEGNNDPNTIETAVRAVLFGYPDVEAETSLFCSRQ